MNDRTSNIIIYVVTAVWVLSTLAGMFRINDYHPAGEINGIFLTIVGGAFLSKIRIREDKETRR